MKQVMDMDYEPEEDVQEQEEPDLPLIDTEIFYDLLMEQQDSGKRSSRMR